MRISTPDKPPVAVDNTGFLAALDNLPVDDPCADLVRVAVARAAINYTRQEQVTSPGDWCAACNPPHYLTTARYLTVIDPAKKAENGF